MDSYISFGPENGTLAPFSLPHLVSVSIILLLCTVFILSRNFFKTDGSRKAFRLAFAVIITLQQAAIYIWYTLAGEWSVEITLPLQLCDLSLFLSIAVLLTKRQLLFELLYYWGLGGATQAILTPDIGNYTFPHFVFYQFFISHCVILLACIYMLAVEKFKPSPKSALRTFLITNLYALFIIPFNMWTGGNYLFLRYKPAGGTLLDLLGPWPWYILSLEAVALLLFSLLYLPFASAGSGSRKPGISA